MDRAFLTALWAELWAAQRAQRRSSSPHPYPRSTERCGRLLGHPLGQGLCSGQVCARGSAVLRAFLPDALRSFSFSPMWMRLRFLSCSAVLGIHPAGAWGPMSSSRGMQAVPDSHPGVPPLCSPLFSFSFHAGNGVCAWRAQNSVPQWRCMNHGVPLHGKGTLCTHLSSPAASGRSL